MITATSSIGRINEYNENEDFESYLERFEFWLEANNIDEAKKAATFLAAVGPKPYKFLKNLIAAAKPRDKTYDQLKEKLKMHYKPKLITMTERAKFYMRNQKTDESVNELRRLAATCDFEGFLDKALRDRFVCGMNDKSTQTKLMAVTKLTF